jgi:hypothetical protein
MREFKRTIPSCIMIYVLPIKHMEMTNTDHATKFSLSLSASEIPVFCLFLTCYRKKTQWSESASELYRPTERPPLVGEVIADFC